MRCTSRIAILFSLIMFLQVFQTFIITDDQELDEGKIYVVETFSHSGLIDVETWQINDNWMYSGYLDVRSFISSSGISTTVDYLYGTLDQTVTEIYLSNIDNQSSITYKVESIGSYGADNIELDGQGGDISVEMNTIEIIRASDMAVVSQEATIEIDFCADFFWTCISVDVADLVVNNTYSPALEGLDFPLNVGESWTSNYHQETTYSGSSDYVDIPDDSEDDNSSVWETVSQGFSGVSYTGCTQSYNITTYDSDGQETGYRWYCPAIKGDIKSSFTQSVGFIAVHELTAYQPSTRYEEISIDIEYPLSPIGANISAWINVTNQGALASATDLEFRYEIEDDIRSITTDNNGSYHLEFNTGNKSDGSSSQDDLASHGIIVWLQSSNPILGAVSVSTNYDIHEIDLVTRTEGVTVQRTRNNVTITLDPNIGFTANHEDELVFSIPVVNKGLSTSPSTVLRIDSPDGNRVFASVIPLASLEEARIEVNWTVPISQSFGYVYLEFLVDPDENFEEDGNKSNNYGSFSLFVGSLPTAILNHSLEFLTLDETILSGTSSIDSDGGEFICEFYIEISENIYGTFFEEDCIYEMMWEDDGEFEISLTIIDEESDQSSIQSSVRVLNRPPQITLISDNSTIQVFSQVTFEITERIDLDTQSPNSPVDIMWDNANCQEGQIGIKCTITPTVEGELTIGVSAVDDDGAITHNNLSVMVTNIAPFDPQIEVWAGPNKIIPDNRGVYMAKEGDLITLQAWATDSANDIDNLRYIWAPDAENNPELEYINEGIMGEINHTYGISGLQLATLQILDNDEAYATFDNNQHTLIIPIEIENIAPSIISISPRLPVQEGEELFFEIGVLDTANDIESLVTCFDIDPLFNSDAIGNSNDDCNFNSTFLSYAWEDADSAPDYIVFHVTDDDGSMDYVEISIDVRNIRPTAIASINSIKPLQGEFISLSANGTIDSEYDIKNMLYHWDTDTSFDSDGDGNPSNDVDMMGRWIQVRYDNEGKKVVKLTVYDESESNSITMVVDVDKAPFNLGTSVKENSSSILLLVLILISALVLTTRYMKNTATKPSFPKIADSDIDSLFESTEGNNSEVKLQEELGIITGFRKPITENSVISQNFSGENPIQLNDMQNEELSVNDVLNDEDIEALFEE